MADDNRTFIIVALVVFILIALFIIAIIVGFSLSDRPASTLTPTNNGLFLDDCTTSPCTNNLVCDGTNFTCRLPAGQPCTDSTDCVSGLLCSGRCASGPTGGLNDLCPCEEGFSCQAQFDGFTRCKGLGGATCGTGTDCVSEICLSNGTCAAGSPNAAPCVSNSNCESGNCSNGFCQDPGRTTGSLGASCAGDCVEFTGAPCISTETRSLFCECTEGTGLPGRCIVAGQGITSSCGPNSFCSEQLFCLNTEGTDCDGATSCLCTFAYDNPNDPGVTGPCIEGMTPSLSGCINTNLGCQSDDMCSSGQCAGGGLFVRYVFSTDDIRNLEIGFPGATNTRVSPLFSSPTGTIEPKKLFATSDGEVDTIWLVDNEQGLFAGIYNTSTDVFAGWSVIIPHETMTTVNGTTTTRIFLDAGTNATTDISDGTLLLVFEETVTTNGNSRTNNTVYTWNNGTITPFNVQAGSGLDGTQYITGGTALTIDYIDISEANDVSAGGDVLISQNGSIYVKPAGQSFYTLGVIQGGVMDGMSMTGTTGPAYFYFDNEQNAGATGPAICPENGTDAPIACPSLVNIAFVGPFSGTIGTGPAFSLQDVLQYSGNIAGLAQPVDRFNVTNPVEYRVFDYSIYSPSTGVFQGMNNSGIIMLTEAYVNDNKIGNMVALSFSGVTALVPYLFGTAARSLATRNAFYVLSTQSCS